MRRSLALIVAAVLLPAPLAAQTLDEAIAKALARAPELIVAEAEKEAADARVAQARSGRMPRATLSGSIGAGRLDPKGFFTMKAASVTPMAAQLVVEMPLFSGGRIAEAINRARAGADASEAAGAVARAAVVAETAEAYSGVRLAREQLALLDGTVTQMRRMEHDARLIFQSGAGPKTDLAQARARLAEAEAGHAQAEGNLAVASARYRILTGELPGSLGGSPAVVVPHDLDAALASAAQNNGHVRQARAGLTAANAEIRSARAERLPEVSAYAEGSAIRDQFFPDYKADSASIGVRGRWQLYDGGLVRAKVAEKSAQARAAEARILGAERQVEQQVTNAWHAMQTARAVKQAAAAQQAAAAEALRDARLEFQIGAKPQLAVLDAEREALAAAMRQSEAAVNFTNAQVRLKAAIGDY